MLASTASAFAQDPDRIFTVNDRFKRILPPEGMPIGSMQLFPKLGVGGLYSDNVFANDAFPRSDYAITSLAEAVLQSETSRYAVELGGRLEMARFDEYDVNDYDNSWLWFRGESDVTNNNRVRLNLRYANLAEPRTSVNVPDNSIELTQFDRSDVELAYIYRPSRWSIAFDGQLRSLAFDDVRTLTGIVNNSDRDRTSIDVGARVGFDFADTYGLFFEARFVDTQFDQRIDDDGFARSFDGQEFRIGTELRLTELLVGEVFVGYLDRQFEDPRYDRARGPSFGAEVDWVVTPLTTLNFGASRITAPTVVLDAAIIQRTRFSIGASHELLRNLIVSLDVEVGDDDFEGIERQDSIDLAEFRVEYRLNRRLWFAARFRHLDRDTEPEGATNRIFEINEVSFDVTFQI
jgi:hypothetical protein